MESARIKNIVIIILLLLNVFLLSLAAGRRIQEERSAAAARSSAVEIIRGSGIQLPDEAIPEKSVFYAMQATRDAAAEEKAAGALLGSGLRVEALGGGVYRYEGATGTIQFHSTGEFLAQLDGGAFPLDGQSAAEHGAQVLRTLGIEAQVLRDGVRDGAGNITFRQTLDGVPLLGCEMTLSYGEGELREITDARGLFAAPVKGAQPTRTQPANVLMDVYNGLRDRGDSFRRIDEITPAYECSISLSGGTRLTPVWYVRTDQRSYQLDAASGELFRLFS